MDDEKLYTAKEVEEKVARQMQQQEMKNVHRTITALQASAATQYSEMTSAIVNLGTQFESKFDNMRNHVDDCREDLRKEIEKDFITIPKFIELENKVDKMWIKIVTAVIAAMAVLNIFFEFWRASA